MATLTITVTAAQAARVAQAFGHAESPMSSTWVPATMPEMQAWILARVRERTLNYEKQQAAITDAATRDAEVW